MELSVEQENKLYRCISALKEAADILEDQCKTTNCTLYETVENFRITAREAYEVYRKL